MLILKEREQDKDKTTLLPTTSILEMLYRCKSFLFKNNKQQKQKTKILTIDQLAPKWSKVFDLMTAKDSNNRSNHYRDAIIYREKEELEIGSSMRCVMGEIRGFNWRYIDRYSKEYCETCHDYAFYNRSEQDYKSFMALNAQITSGGVGPNWREHPCVTSFLEHWSEKHLENNK